MIPICVIPRDTTVPGLRHEHRQCFGRWKLSFSMYEQQRLHRIQPVLARQKVKQRVRVAVMGMPANKLMLRCADVVVGMHSGWLLE